MTTETKWQSIRISTWVKENLKVMKLHPNQSYNEVIENMIKAKKEEKVLI